MEKWKCLRKDSDAKLVCIAERPHFRDWKATLQRLWYWLFFKKYGGRFKAVMAMGSLGVDCFEPAATLQLILQGGQSVGCVDLEPKQLQSAMKQISTGQQDEHIGVNHKRPVSHVPPPPDQAALVDRHVRKRCVDSGTSSVQMCFCNASAMISCAPASWPRCLSAISAGGQRLALRP